MILLFRNAFLFLISLRYVALEVILDTSRHKFLNYTILQCLHSNNYSAIHESQNDKWIYQAFGDSVYHPIFKSSHRYHPIHGIRSRLVVANIAQNDGTYRCVKSGDTSLPNFSIVSTPVVIQRIPRRNYFSSLPLHLASKTLSRPTLVVCSLNSPLVEEQMLTFTAPFSSRNNAFLREVNKKSSCQVFSSDVNWLHQFTMHSNTSVMLSCLPPSLDNERMKTVELTWWRNGVQVNISYGAASVITNILLHPSHMSHEELYQCMPQYVNNSATDVPLRGVAVHIKLKSTVTPLRVRRNAKGNSLSTKQTLKLSAQTDETSIHLVWSRPQADFTISNYRVGWGKTFPGEVTKHLPSSSLSYTLSNLDSNQLYMIKVTVIGHNGEEQLEEQITAPTKARGFRDNLAIPVNVGIDDIKEDSATVTWERPPAADGVPFKIAEYEVKCLNRDDEIAGANLENVGTVTNVSGNVTTVLIQSLISGLTYRCSVRSVYRLLSTIHGNYTEEYRSHWSMESSFVTRNRAPAEPPQNISIHMLKSSPKIHPISGEEYRCSVRISWQPPGTPRQTFPMPIRQYHVFYSADPSSSADRGATHWASLTVPGHELNVIVGELLPDTYYYLYMQANNEVGPGPTSSILVIRTTSAEGWGGGQVVLPKAYTDLRVLIQELSQTGELDRLPRMHSREKPVSVARPATDSPEHSVTGSPNMAGNLLTDNMMWFVTAGILGATVLLIIFIVVLLAKCRPSRDVNSTRYKSGSKKTCADPRALCPNGRAGLDYGNNDVSKSRLMNHGNLVGLGDSSNSPLLGPGAMTGGMHSASTDTDPLSAPYPMATIPGAPGNPMMCMGMNVVAGGGMQLPDLFVHTPGYAGGNMLELDNRRASNSGLGGSSSTEDTPGGGDLTSISQRHLFTASAYNSPNNNEMLTSSAVYTTTPNPSARRNNNPGIGAPPPGLMHTHLSSPHHQNMLPNNMVGVVSPSQRGMNVASNYFPHQPQLNLSSQHPGSAQPHLPYSSAPHSHSNSHVIPSHVPRVNASELVSSDAVSGGPMGKKLVHGKNILGAATLNSTGAGDSYGSPIRNGMSYGRGDVTSGRGGTAVDRASVLSHSDHEIPKNFSTEELSQEMANLEGLMKDLKAITQKEFEC